MSKRETQILLEDILENINNIEEFIKGLDKEKFINNKMATAAVVRCLEIIGEATKNIPDNYRINHPEISWRDMAGLRDVVIHGYFSVDLDIIWEIVTKDLPDIKKKIINLS